MREAPGRADAGISLVEVLVAMLVALTVTTIASVLAIQAQASWRADDARVDLQQRARVTSDLFTRALRAAGLGPSSAGPPLVHVLPPILPRRTGARDADSPDVFRPDALTIISAVAEREHALLLTAAPAGATVLDLAASPPCTQMPCGLAEGSHVLLFDSAGHYDLFTVVRLEESAAVVRHHGGGTTVAYPPGTRVIPVDSSSYYLDAPTRTLRVYDGDRTDLPLVDDVVELRAAYYGDPRPPVLPRPRIGEANCLYAADGTYQAALMPLWPGDGLSVFDAASLTDGPWCGGGSNRFDADLLRVRRVRLHVRLQASNPAVRGGHPVLFRHPGTATHESTMVSDTTVGIDVFPPNLGGVR